MPDQIIYELETVGIAKKDRRKEDVPDAYRVVKNDNSAGIIVYGKYSDGSWQPNPSCRFLIAHLLRLARII